MIVILDTETSHFKGRIMQLAYGCYMPGTETLGHECNDFLRHDEPYEVHDDAYAVHGLTYTYCQLSGIDPRIVLGEAVRCLNGATVIVGHKLQFDLAMISKECLYYGVGFQYSMTDPRLVCTMAKSKEFCNLRDSRNRPKFPSLSELHQYLFDCGFEDAHDAMNDVRATARCYFELKKRGII